MEGDCPGLLNDSIPVICACEHVLVAADLYVRGGNDAGGLLPSVVTHHSDRATSAFLVLLP